MTKREQLIHLVKLVQGDMSDAVGYPCGVYHESEMYHIYRTNSAGEHLGRLTSVYDLKTLYKVALDITSIIKG